MRSWFAPKNGSVTVGVRGGTGSVLAEVWREQPDVFGIDPQGRVSSSHSELRTIVVMSSHALSIQTG